MAAESVFDAVTRAFESQRKLMDTLSTLSERLDRCVETETLAEASGEALAAQKLGKTHDRVLRIGSDLQTIVARLQQLE